ncbi:hypothetical protein LEQ_0600c [Ligilactobacillus equi DPC 6820]|uniref:Uncharacterized protein n=2 Tax=Ligilactobacillus equi TaxID=137357 RepID=V7HXT7_9LACO|nr:hypothetical protein LEQ_0600c [Ligilactobacillus equi DPC 6820]
MEDINDKSAKVDPLFTTIGEVGESLSELNTATRNTFEKVSSTTSRFRTAQKAFKTVQVVNRIYQKHQAKKVQKEVSK